MKALQLLAAGVAVALGLAGQAWAADGGCQLAKIGELPVKMVGYRPLVQATINGKPVRFVLDTGAFFTSISASAAQDLGLASGVMEGLRVMGIGGETNVRVAKAADFGIEGATFHNVELLVLGSPASDEEGPQGRGARPQAADPPVVGLLGQNFFRRMDVEYDFAGGVVRLFVPKGCAKANMAYWAQSYSQAELKSPAPESSEMDADVVINGRAIRAELDTGASSSLVDLGAAGRSGVTPQSPGVVKAQAVRGLGKTIIDAWVGRFDSFSLGDETIKNPPMVMADMTAGQPQRTPTGSHLNRDLVKLPEVLLGADFFLSHRIYAAHSQDKIYFTYNGGPVFEAAVQTAEAKSGG